ncbi:hypothetical protein [Teredinibacter waterburyi]|uniref:hypothetical protein n=1 Tax=Teredinibacter waterburyi TaxID=1500538 RepID=UPI00165FB6A5|nr:hypothetical protein [Teredinibacter waterburyi]
MPCKDVAACGVMPQREGPYFSSRVGCEVVRYPAASSVAVGFMGADNRWAAMLLVAVH